MKTRLWTTTLRAYKNSKDIKKTWHRRFNVVWRHFFCIDPYEMMAHWHNVLKKKTFGVQLAYHQVIFVVTVWPSFFCSIFVLFESWQNLCGWLRTLCLCVCVSTLIRNNKRFAYKMVYIGRLFKRLPRMLPEDILIQNKYSVSVCFCCCLVFGDIIRQSSFARDRCISRTHCIVIDIIKN